MGELKEKKIIQAMQFLDPNKPDIIPDLDYNYTFPISVYEAIKRTMDDNSTNLQDELDSIYRLINGKQATIDAGTPGELMTWSGIQGNIGSMEVVKAIDPDISKRSNMKIPTERAVGDSLDTKASLSTLNNHMNDSSVHITDAERTRWSSMTPLTTFQNHIQNMNLHVTNDERARWNSRASQDELDTHRFDTNNPHNVTANQVGTYTRREIDDLISDIRESFFNYLNIEWDERTNQAKLVEYHPANWNPNYILGFDEELPDVEDVSLVYFAIRPATDYETNESDDAIIYIKRPGLVWQEVGYHSMSAGDMLIGFPDTVMYVWMQGRFLRLFSDSAGVGGNDGLDGKVWRPHVAPDGTLTWTISDSEVTPDPVNIKGEDGYTPVKGVDYDDGKDGAGVPVGGDTGDILVKLTQENHVATWRSPDEIIGDLVIGGWEFPEGSIAWGSISGRPGWYDEPGEKTDGFMTQRATTALYSSLNSTVNEILEQISSPTGVEGIRKTLYEHLSDYNNPHRVTPAIIGAVSLASFNEHVQNFNNPHNVTADTIGLGNVENYSSKDMPISDAQEEAFEELRKKLDLINQNVEGMGFVTSVKWEDNIGELTFKFSDEDVSDLVVNIPINALVDTINNLYFDDNRKELVFVMPDGTENRVSINSIVMAGSNGTHINIAIEDNAIKANLIPGSITGLEIETSVSLRGSPTATTQPVGDKSTRIANTEIVKTIIHDNLVSYDADRPLSANMGRILNSTKASIDDVLNLLNNFEGIDLIDSLDSTSAVAALSANMGRYLDLTKAPRVHTSPDGATYGRATISLFGHARASEQDPIMDGTVFRGTDDGRYARGDHRHPTDETRAPIHSPEFTGEPRTPTPPDDSNDDRIANTEWVRRNAVGVSKGFCTTNGDTAVKVVVLKSTYMAEPTFIRQIGSTVSVTFDNTDTSGATTTQLDIQDSGAAPVTYGGIPIIDNMIAANHTHIFTFDGTSWKLMNPAGVHPLAENDSSNRFVYSAWVRGYAYSKTDIDSKVDNINNEINTIKGRVTNVENDITNIKGDITNINTKVSNLETSVTTINNTINNTLNNVVMVQSSQPAGNRNRLWVNTGNGILYYWSGSVWTPLNAFFPTLSADPSNPLAGQVWIR